MSTRAYTWITSATMCTLFFAPNMSAASHAIFLRNLVQGDRDEDVRTLQKILNESPDTRVAEAGAGSPGWETNYFGPATRAALARFQEKHAADILAPLGLSRGTGFFGAATRAKIAAHTESAPIPAQSAAAPTPSIPVKKNDPLSVFSSAFPATGDLFVMFPSVYFGPAGTSVIIHGSGFDMKKNTIRFGNMHTIPNVPAAHPSRISFIIPASVPPGIYDLWVENETNGIRRASDRGAFFVITPAGAQAPSIASLTPARAKWGDTITIRGSGFSSDGNIIRTGFEIIRDVPSPDGHTLSFAVKPSVFADAVKNPYDTGKTVGFPVEAYVVNANGVSGGGKFIFEI